MSADTRDSTTKHHLTRIVATLGPASYSDEGINALLAAGTDIFRLNFSHGSHKQHKESIKRIRSLARQQGKIPTILQDIPGPKLRIGDIKDDLFHISVGDVLLFRTDGDKKGDSTSVWFESDGWHRSIQPGERVLLGDGAMELEVVRVSDIGLVTRANTQGEIRSRQGLNFPDTDLKLSAVTDDDWDHIAFGLSLSVDAVALSFVQEPNDLIPVRQHLQRKGFSAPLLIAKIETPKAVENIHEIMDHCDGVMVARGDLGISMPIEQIPVIQKKIIQTARDKQRFVITATQMLESMTQAKRPTRAEATDVANAVYDGTDAVMLSGETAIGRHPAAVVETMRKILLATEPSVELPSMRALDTSVDSSIVRAVKQLAKELGVIAVLAPLSSGSTALRLSRQRMGVPILVGTATETLARRLVFYQGVYPVIVDPDLGLKGTTESLIDKALKARYVQTGDHVILSGGLPVEKEGTTNFLRALTVGDEI
jgi:pyruvate kinase